MAYLSQYEIDMQQDARNRQNQAAIGNAVTQGIQGLEENRKRALELDARKKVMAREQEAYDYQKTQRELPVEEQDAFKRESAMQRLKRADDLKTMEEREAIRAKYRAPKDNTTYQEKLDLKAQKAAEVEAQKRQDPNYKLEKLGAEGRSKVGSLASGFQALDQMGKAMEDGFGPRYVDANTSMIGGLISDTPYSEGERMVSEVIGRLQSGGAINDQEIKTFRALGPRPGDSKEAAARKLAQQKDFLANKLTAFGVNNDDLSTLGFETTSKYVPKNAQQPPPVDPLKLKRLEELRAKKAGVAMGGQ